MAAPGEKPFCVLEHHTCKSVVIVQRGFRAKYAKDPPTDKATRAWYKQFTETGCLWKQKSGGHGEHYETPCIIVPVLVVQSSFF
jgi:hypothetical protein